MYFYVHHKMVSVLFRWARAVFLKPLFDRIPYKTTNDKMISVLLISISWNLIKNHQSSYGKCSAPMGKSGFP